MRKLLTPTLWLISLLLLPLTTPAQPPKPPRDGLTEFKCAEGNCTVRFPGVPKPVKTDTKVGATTVYSLEIPQQGAYAFNVTALPIQPNQDDELLEKRLVSARNGSLKRVGAELDSETKIKLGNHPGREFIGIIPGKGMIRSRIFLVDTKLYQLLVVGTPELVESAKATKVLQSLKLNKQ